MKTLIKAGTLAPFILATGMVNATTNFGMLSAGENFASGPIAYGASVSTFDDDYTFQLSDYLNVDGLLANWLVYENGSNTIRSDNMTVDLFSDNAGSWNLLEHWDVAAGGTVLYNENIGPGSYLINVAGDVTGSDGSTYAINGVVSVVPEPSTYALMLGGLGLVGFMATRKRKINLA